MYSINLRRGPNTVSYLKPGVGSLLRSDSSDIENQVRHELALLDSQRLWTRVIRQAVVHISRAYT